MGKPMYVLPAPFLTADASGLNDDQILTMAFGSGLLHQDQAI